MAILDSIRQMREQGIDSNQIAQSLKEQGFSPLEINQALEQSNIKAAVSQEEYSFQGNGEMEPSLMTPQPGAEAPIPITPEQPAPGMQEYGYPAPQAYYPEYQPYSEYQPGAETMTEIAEQISEEKLNKLRNELSLVTEFRTMAEREMKNIDERLKRIEDIIDRLQASILGKIGLFGQNIEDLKKEMKMTQESFSKVIHSPKSREKSKKKTDGFEHYLRS